jgi:hypothetical protein
MKVIRFKLDELPDLIPGFHGKLARAKRMSPPGRWRPSLNLSIAVQQDEDSDQWQAWLNWTLLDGGGVWPCRDAAKHESISPTDPPDRFKTLLMAETFAENCMTQFRAQYNEWIHGDHGSTSTESGND